MPVTRGFSTDVENLAGYTIEHALKTDTPHLSTFLLRGNQHSQLVTALSLTSDSENSTDSEHLILHSMYRETGENMIC